MRCVQCYMAWDRPMLSNGESAKGISRRLRSRLQRRYLRWLVAHPSDSFCRSTRWRNFWRSNRRRFIHFVNLRPVQWFLGAIVVMAAFAVAGMAVVVIGFIGWLLTMTFFAPPEHHPFISDAQRSAVALTRLSIYQTVAISLAVIFCGIRSHAPKSHERREFFNRRRDVRQLIRSIVIAGLILVVGSAAVLSGVSWRLPHRLLSIGTSVLVAGNLGWFAVALCRRAMGVRVPRLPAQTVTILTLGSLFMLIMPMMTLLYGPIVFDVSQDLARIGPLGRVNSWLYELGEGQFERLLPLVALCAILAAGGYALHRSASRWAFRRRLLSLTRVIERDYTKRASDVCTPPKIARDLRGVLSGRARWSWRSIVFPRWIQGNRVTLLLIPMTLFLLQAVMIALGLFLERLEAANDAGTLPEKLVIFGLASSAAAWSVLSMEVAAAGYREIGKLVTFAARPVSPWDVWLDIQREGMAFVPTQILYSIPFVLTLALFSRDFLVHGSASIGVALLTCIACRTLLVAGICLSSVSANLRFWIRYPLEWILAMGGSLIVFGIGAQAMLVPIEGSLLSVVVRQLILNVLALFVLAVAVTAWHAGSAPSRKSLH